jgi:hypothetical protein
MFARFRETKSTLQVTVLEGRRVDGRVRHEQVATLGSVKLPLTVEGREKFWQALHQRLAKLGNRLDAAEQAKILAAVHQRVPMVTADERRERELALAEREQVIWDSMRDILAERAEGLAGMASKAAAAAAADRRAASDASAWAADAADRRERLRRGEDAPPGQEIDPEQILRDAGVSPANIRHMKVMAALGEEAHEALFAAHHAAGQRAERAAARRMLRAKARRP